MKKLRQETCCPRPLSTRPEHTPTTGSLACACLPGTATGGCERQEDILGSHEGLWVPPGTGCPPQKGQGGCWQDGGVGGLGLLVAYDSSSAVRPAGASPLRPGVPHAAPRKEHWPPLFHWGWGQGRSSTVTEPAAALKQAGLRSLSRPDVLPDHHQVTCPGTFKDMTQCFGPVLRWGGDSGLPPKGGFGDPQEEQA